MRCADTARRRPCAWAPSWASLSGRNTKEVLQGESFTWGWTAYMQFCFQLFGEPLEFSDSEPQLCFLFQIAPWLLPAHHTLNYWKNIHTTKNWNGKCWTKWPGNPSRLLSTPLNHPAQEGKLLGNDHERLHWSFWDIAGWIFTFLKSNKEKKIHSHCSCQW